MKPNSPSTFSVLSRSWLLAIGALALSACGGGGDDDPAPVVPSISSFTAAKSTITSGTSTTLTGVFANGSGLVGNGVGAVTSGTAASTGNLTADTTFVLTVTSSTGQVVSSTAAVHVVPAPAISAFQAQNAIVTESIGTWLAFTFAGGSGSIDNGIGAVTSGTPVYITPAATTTYTLTVTSAASATANSTATVTVVPHPVLNWFVASPTTVRPGGTTTLTASFGGGVGVVSGPGGDIGTMVSGVPFDTNIAQSSTLTLTVTSPAGIALTKTADVAVSHFSATGRLNADRGGHLATVLANGQVLITGGANPNTVPATQLVTAEIYDPVAGTFSATGSLPAGFIVVTATRLLDGRVLVISATQAAQLYDPATGTFTATGSTIKQRYSPTATLLQDGKVLLIGGVLGVGPDKTAELYDPASGTFRYTAGLESRNQSIHRSVSVLLNSGAVLNCGGYDGSNGPSTTSACELYDPATETFRNTGTMVVARIGPKATLLADGRVLIAGGLRNNFAMAGPEIYDPATEVSTTTGVLPSTSICSLNILPDGQVLLAGLWGTSSPYERPNYLFNPATGALTDVGRMAEYRQSCDFATANLGNGRVLISGGYTDSADGYRTAELFY
jgi:hypothetical protein